MELMLTPYLEPAVMMRKRIRSLFLLDRKGSPSPSNLAQLLTDMEPEAKPRLLDDHMERMAVRDIMLFDTYFAEKG